MGQPVELVSTDPPRVTKTVYIKRVKHRDTPMNIQLTGYQIESVMQALQDSDTLWEARIEQAERGDRQNLSIEGARMMQDDLREVMSQIKAAW